MLMQVALTSEANSVGFSELATVSAALQKQVLRDFSPIWDVQATVDPFADLDDVPLGYWPVIIVPEVAQGAGVHLDRNGQPYALVEAGSSWSLTASHEVLEMLADPFGNRLIAGYSPRVDQGRVEFLVEVCDPSEDDDYAYTSNGVLVSDFYTPNYFDPEPATGVRYSFTDSIKSPRSVLPGGYLSWHDPVSDQWFQLVHFGAEPEFRDLGQITGQGSLRALIDSATPEIRRLCRLDMKRHSMVACKRARTANIASEVPRAALLRAQISAVTNGPPKPRTNNWKKKSVRGKTK
jgi:hypothetical protein